MREPHLVSFKFIDTPNSPSTLDAGRGVVLGDDGHIANGFLDVDLEALAALASTGLIARTGAGTVATRTITAPAAGITITNGDGVAGNPTLALANDLAAYEGLAANGMVARTADGAAAARTITGTAGSVTVTNGDGVAGNPVISLDATLAALAAANWALDTIAIGTGVDTVGQVAFAANTFPAKASTGALVAKAITDFGLSLVDDADAATGRTTLGCGTMATQNATAVAITGGAIDGTTIGATTRSSGAFTTTSAVRGANGDVSTWQGVSTAKVGYLYSDGTYVGIFDAAATAGNGFLFGEATPKVYCFVNGAIVTTTAASGLAVTGEVSATSSIKSSSPTAGVGYATGAGGAVTQLTSKSTGVTLNTVCGQITMHNEALPANSGIKFTVTNSAVAATDTVEVNQTNGALGSYVIQAHPSAGAVQISVHNLTAGSLSEALVLNFTVTKGVAA